MGSSSPPKPLRPIPLRERLTLQALHKGVIGHFHDHDDDYLLEHGHGRRKRAAKAEADTVEPAIPLFFPPPLPCPAVKNFDLFSPRPEGPLPATAGGVDA